jgi:hypothetical protein
MKPRPKGEGTQMRLTLPVGMAVTMSEETERRLVEALADLLLVVARRSDVATGGGRDEREDRR